MSVVKPWRRISPGKPQTAEQQADAEAETALNPELDRRLVGAFSGAEQIAAVHPRGRHGQRGHPDGHVAASHDEVRCRSFMNTARREPAHGHEGQIHRNNGGTRRKSLTEN